MTRASDLAAAFPIGASITLEALASDPYPIYARLRESEPISWLPALNMYYVVRYDDVDAILRDPERFSVGTENSTLFDTFGTHMLTVEDPLHERYKSPFRPTFMPSGLRGWFEEEVADHASGLIDGFTDDKKIELRAAFACRLPILTMLSLFGLPLEHEADLRRWYDSFEAALANFQWHCDVRQEARRNVEEFRALIQSWIDRYRDSPDSSALLSALANAPAGSRLSDEAIQCNSLIILFGGISTVEALILNAIYALSAHPDTFDRVRANPSLIPSVLDETIRWAGPVQSATRHVARNTVFAGIDLPAGAIVNCMIAAANRDPAKFADPDRFDITRHGLRHHVGFAVGPHHCLGSNLAKLQGRIALEQLLLRLPGCRMSDQETSAPHGSEFRRPAKLELVWD